MKWVGGFSEFDLILLRAFHRLQMIICRENRWALVERESENPNVNDENKYHQTQHGIPKAN